MALVDSDELDRLKQKQLTSYNPTIRSMAMLKDEVDTVLERGDLSAEEKVAIIRASKQRFQGFNVKNITQPMGTSQPGATQFDLLGRPTLQLAAALGVVNGAQPVAAALPPAQPAAPVVAQPAAPVAVQPVATGAAPLTAPPPKTVASSSLTTIAKIEPRRATSSASRPDVQETIVLKDIWHGVPKSSKPKAQRLLDFLQEKQSLISIGAKGELVIGGNTFPNSNIGELLNDTFLRKSKGPVANRDEFLWALNEINVPHEHIPNHSIVASLKQFDPIARYALDYKPHSSGQEGEGLRRPPGKKPRILYVYKM